MNREFAVGDRVLGRHVTCLNWHGEITNIKGDGRHKKFTILWHEHGEEDHPFGHLWLNNDASTIILPNPLAFNEVEEDDGIGSMLINEGNENPEGEMSFETVADPTNENNDEPVVEENNE